MKKSKFWKGLVLGIAIIFISTVAPPIILISYASPDSVELYYDDGTSEEGPAWNLPGGGFAVRFNSPFQNTSQNTRILKAKLYFHALNNPSDSIKIRVLDLNKQDIISPIYYTVSQSQEKTWIEIDLSSYTIIVDGDFYIAEEQMVAGDPDIGSDTSSTHSGRSWGFNGVSWKINSETNYMIRAVVEDADVSDEPIEPESDDSTSDDIDEESKQKTTVSSFDRKLSSSAGLQLTDGIYVSATYTVDATMSIPGDGGVPGESKNCEITLENGQITLSVSVDKWGYDLSGTEQQSLLLGTSVDIPIPNTAGMITAPVSISATVNNIQGSGILSINTNSIKFSSEGTKSFSVKISDNAQEGDFFDISAIVSLDLDVGVIADIPIMGEQSLAQETLPMSSMSPTLEMTGIVKSQSFGGFGDIDLEEPTTLLLILVIVVAIIAAIALAIRKKTKKKVSDKKQETIETKKESKSKEEKER